MQHENFKESIKLYNSQIASAELVKTNFVIRLREFNKIWNDIENSTMQHPEQHYIVQGVRGAGKTTLLRRLAIEIEEHTELSQWLIPVTFKEEEYGITSLFTFWEKVAEILEETSQAEFAPLVDQIDELTTSDPKLLFKVVNSFLNKANKKVVLFIDNIVDIFEHFGEKEEEVLREILTTNNNFRIIGGSATSLESFFDNNAPFYQFFKLITLKGLTKKDTEAMLKSLAKHAGEKEQKILKSILKNTPGKIESIRRLTGGVPRTMSILFNVLMEGPQGTAFTLLEETIDKTTPLYKHRMDDLSKQQKPIVNAIALNWQAISVKELTEKTGLESKKISAQLNQLEKQWVIEKIKTDTKNHLYAIKERFFNIWYLMRYGRRRDKNRVKWLTEFIEIWCNEEDLLFRAQSFREQLAKSCHPTATLTVANAYLASNKLPYGEKQKLREDTAQYFENSGNKKLKKELFSLPSSDEENRLAELINRLKISATSLSNQEHDEVKSLLNFYKDSYLKASYYFLCDNYEESIQHLHQALETQNNIIPVKLMLAICYFSLGRNKKDALSIAEDLYDSKCQKIPLLLLVEINIWNNKFDRAVSLAKDLLLKFKTDEVDKENLALSMRFLRMLLIKEQYNLIRQLISEHQLEDRLRPFLVLSSILEADSLEKEINRVPSEVRETIDNLITGILSDRNKYQ